VGAPTPNPIDKYLYGWGLEKYFRPREYNLYLHQVDCALPPIGKINSSISYILLDLPEKHRRYTGFVYRRYTGYIPDVVDGDVSGDARWH
jgi:hypothetical protein